jgi:predicted ATP-grasp superfamily ATP-dependent carboligase
MAEMTHAVVVRGELNGLGVIRSLARGGVPTVLVDTTRLRAGTWSRFCRVRIVEQLHGADFVRDLLDLQRELGGRPVLLLTDEMAVTTVSEHRDQLAAAYRFQLPPADMVTKLSDKARFQEFAEINNLPVPRTAVLKCEVDLARLGNLRFPVIVKPADKRPVYLGATERLHVVSNLAQCNVLCRQLLRTAGELVVQEWIDGPDSNIYFSLFYRGRDPDRLTIFSGRKIVCNPPKIGSTALCVAAPEAANVLEALTRACIELSSYRGLGSIEFKFDSNHQRFVIIEPTVGRTDWQEEIATLNGVNLPLAAYRHEMGLPPLRSTKLTPAAAWQESIAHWTGRFALPAAMRIYDGYWRLNDPVPAFVFYGSAATKRLHRNVVRPLFGPRRADRLRNTATKPTQEPTPRHP